jgi:hypothetical protein
MEGRPYAVLESNGITRFLLPRRARTVWLKAAGAAMMATGAGMVLVVGYLGWLLLRHGDGPLAIHGAQWIAMLLLVVSPVPLKYGWEILRGGQGEVRVCVAGNFLRATDGVALSALFFGLSVEWEHLLLTDIETLQIEDVREPFMPKENAYLWVRRLNGMRVRILSDYPRWLLEELAAEIEPLIEESRKQVDEA